MRYVESLNQALHQLMKENENVFVLGEDILDPYGGAFKVTKGLSTAYPDRVLTTPISEASLTGFATGMSMRGLRPVLEIMFGDFLALCADQLLNGACKFSWMYNGGADVPLVIRTPMGGRRGYGATHSQTIETILLNVPFLTMVAPSHFHDPGCLLKTAVEKTSQPLLFIENKTLYPQRLNTPNDSGVSGEFFLKYICKHSTDFPSVSLVVDQDEAPHVILVAYGGMAPLAVDAALEVFLQEDIIVEVILPSLIKPFPFPDIEQSVIDSGRLVIAEEAPRTAGWGAELSSQVYEKCFEKLKKPICRVASKDLPIPSCRRLEDEVLSQMDDIVQSIYQQVR